MRHIIGAIMGAALAAPVAFGIGITLQIGAATEIRQAHTALDAELRTACVAAVVTGERWMYRTLAMERALGTMPGGIDVEPWLDYERTISAP